MKVRIKVGIQDPELPESRGFTEVICGLVQLEQFDRLLA
jgi:hypothetical protein